MSKRPSKNRPTPAPSAPSTAVATPPVPSFGAVILLVCAALGISLYLSTHSSFGAPLLGCGPASGCDAVLGSRWSHLGPVPVSWLAVLVEVVWLISLLASRPLGKHSTAVMAVGVLCASSAFASAVWFTALQAFVLKAFCPYCLASHLCVSIAAILQCRLSGWTIVKQTAGWGAAAALAMVIGQVAVEPKTSAVESLQGAGQTNATPVAAVEPLFELYGGAFRLKPSELPRMGPTNSPRYVVSLFDYTCHICRDLHHLMEQELPKYPGEFQIINLVMPLCADCNPLMTSTQPAHVNACFFARLGLAVFRAAPEKSAEFDRYVFDGPKPPPVIAARAKASEIVGTEALAKAWDDPWVVQRIEENIRLYKSNYYKVRRGEMPQLILGDTISAGAIKDPKEFAALLRNQWGLEPKTNLPPAAPSTK